MKRFVLIFLQVVILALPLAGRAGRNDINLSKLAEAPWSTLTETQKFTAVNNFKGLVLELSTSMGPHMTLPADTLGHLGFEISFETYFTNINEKAEYWTRGVGGSSGPSGVLSALALRFSKGLPWSFQLGAAFTWLSASGMYALGLDFKWAVNEGFKYAPDIAFKGSVTVLMGARDLQLVCASPEFIVSKEFPVSGVLTLTPYTGYSALIINASSHVLDSTPGDLTDLSNNFVFAPYTGVMHRFFLGLRMKTFFATITALFEYIKKADYMTAAVQTWMLKASFDF